MEANSPSQASSAEIRSKNNKTPLPNELLQSAWKRHDVYSDNAKAAQTRFLKVRRWIIGLNVFAVFLAVFHAELGKIRIILEQTALSQFPMTSEQALETTAQSPQLANLLLQIKSSDEAEKLSSFTESLDSLTGNCLILIPIVISVLLAFAVKFDKGNNWILLRGSAEALKMEIFYYRAQVGEYIRNRDGVLARKIKLISERLKGSAVHQTALSPYEGEALSWQSGWVNNKVKQIRQRLGQLGARLRRFLLGELKSREQDDKYSDLDSPMYLTHRLEDQFEWYRKKCKHLNRQLQWLQTGVYIFGGIGTLLAAIQLQSWVAVTTALTGALINYLEFKRVEATLVGYNQAADALYDIRAWWTSLPLRDQENSENFALLVKSTEETIRSEHISWLQDMQDKLAQLYGQKPEDETKKSVKPLDSDKPEAST